MDDVVDDWVAVARGPFGELLPPSLVEGLLDAEVQALLDQYHVTAPTGLERAYLQQLLLREAVAGRPESDNLAQDIHEAVVERHIPLSLRPLGQEDLDLPFAPVLTCLGGVAWRVGLPYQRRVEFLVADDPAAAVAQAQTLYVRWCAEAEAGSVNGDGHQ